MRHFSVFTCRALLAASLLLTPAWLLAAEPFPIALVNIDRIFKDHKPFHEKIVALQAEVKELDQTVQLRQAELETVAGQFRKAQPGTPDSVRLQAQAMKLQNELQQFVNTEKQNVQKKEASLYVGFHRQLDAEMSKYAKAHGIKLIIRQQETSLDENQPLPEIVKALGRGVLYEDGIDITDQILKALDARIGSGGAQR